MSGNIRFLDRLDIPKECLVVDDFVDLSVSDARHKPNLNVRKSDQVLLSLRKERVTRREYASPYYNWSTIHNKTDDQRQ